MTTGQERTGYDEDKTLRHNMDSEWAIFTCPKPHGYGVDIKKEIRRFRHKNNPKEEKRKRIQLAQVNRESNGRVACQKGGMYREKKKIGVYWLHSRTLQAAKPHGPPSSGQRDPSRNFDGFSHIFPFFDKKFLIYKVLEPEEAARCSKRTTSSSTAPNIRQRYVQRPCCPGLVRLPACSDPSLKHFIISRQR